MAEKIRQSTIIGRRCEIRAFEKRKSKKGDLVVIAKDEHTAVNFDPNVEYALVVENVFKDDGKLDKTILTINSANILSALKEICGDDHSHPTTFDQPVQMESPFIDLYHHWEQVEQCSMTAEDDTVRMHLNLLLTFMRKEMGHERTQLLDMIQSGSITFFKLWTIFKPGDVVCTEEQQQPWLLKLERTAYEESAKTGRRFEVHCSGTRQDGTRLSQTHEKIIIYEKEIFPGGTPRKITALPAYPRQFVLDKSIESRLEQRGEECEELCGILNMHYNGQAEYLRTPPKQFFDPSMRSWDLVWMPFAETARVVIDAGTFLEEYAKAKESIIPQMTEVFQKWATSVYGSLERASRILCAPYVWGFSLQEKKWCKFSVRNLRSIEWNHDMMHNLVLPQRRKELLRALVTAHEFPTTGAREEAQHKGKGLVILLHGTPGSGKTLSAEASAETTCSALIKISLGDLYANNYFDKALLRDLLQYATIWKAIVVFDEADVFLQARSSSTGELAQRNGIVAVFLRYLEYFSGIVFLTSNRVEDFDRAMKSRIHLALQFTPPPDETRRKIWRQQLLTIAAEGRDFGFNQDGGEVFLEELAQEDMNGREIANAIGTAATLARFNKQKLNAEHLATVVDAWRDFGDSLVQLEVEQQIEPRQDTLVANASKTRQDSVTLASSNSTRGWLP